MSKSFDRNLVLKQQPKSGLGSLWILEDQQTEVNGCNPTESKATLWSSAIYMTLSTLTCLWLFKWISGIY